jgi:hypothetical protein
MLLKLSVVEQRYHAVMEVLAGVAATDVAARYDVLPRSVHSWITRYREAGLSGLADRSHCPLTHPRQLAAEIEGRDLRAAPGAPEVGPAPARPRARAQRSGSGRIALDHLPGAQASSPGRGAPTQATSGRLRQLGT